MSTNCTASPLTSSSSSDDTAMIVIYSLAAALFVAVFTNIILIMQLCCFTSKRQRHASARALTRCLCPACCCGGDDDAVNDGQAAEQLEANARHPRRAPCDPAIKTTIIFTDTECANRLQQLVPDEVEKCLMSQAAMVRRVIIHFQAYEVRPVGDGFMIAIVSPVLAVKLALELMRRNDEMSGPTRDDAAAVREAYAKIAPTSDGAVEMPFRRRSGKKQSSSSRNRHHPQQPRHARNKNLVHHGGHQLSQHSKFAASKYKDGGEEGDEDDDEDGQHDDDDDDDYGHDEHAEGEVQIHPPYEHLALLRMRIGIHVGHCRILFQQDTNEYDYRGDTPEIAARLATLAHGRQLLVSRQIVEAVKLMYGGDRLLECAQFRFIDEVDAGGHGGNHALSLQASGVHLDQAEEQDEDSGFVLDVFQVDAKCEEDGSNRRETMIVFPPLRVARARELTAEELLSGIVSSDKSDLNKTSSSDATAHNSRSLTPESVHNNDSAAGADALLGGGGASASSGNLASDPSMTTAGGGGGSNTMLMPDQTMTFGNVFGSSMSMASCPGGAGASGGEELQEYATRFLHTLLAAVPRDMRNKTLNAFLLSWGVPVPAAFGGDGAKYGASAVVVSPNKKQKVAAAESAKALKALSSKVMKVIVARDLKATSRSATPPGTVTPGGGGSQPTSQSQLSQGNSSSASGGGLDSRNSSINPPPGGRSETGELDGTRGPMDLPGLQVEDA